MTLLQKAVVVLIMVVLVFGIGGWYLYRLFDLGTLLEGRMGEPEEADALGRQITLLVFGTVLVGGVLIPLIFGRVLFLVLNVHSQPNAFRNSITATVILGACILLVVFAPMLPRLFER